MTAANTDYQFFQGQRQKLAALLDKALPPFQQLSMSGWADAVKKLSARVASERFRVIILGEFKRGKSTFINALLQEEMLPAFVTPCTAVIGEVKFGEKKRAILYFRDPPPTEMPSTLPKDASRHMEKNRARPPIPPLEIDVRDLEQFVVIPDPGKDQGDSVAESPFDRVELFWPLELCRNGVEIIDSPSLNEHRTRTKTTKDYLSQVDAVVFVMSVHALAGESELAVVDHDVRGAGHEYIFFVCNRFDELRKTSDRERVTKFAYEKLTERTRFGREGIFFLSALDALDGRVEGDAGRVDRSGIVPLENALARFLTRDRGRVKLLQPASQLALGLKKALHETIPERRKMLSEDAQKLSQRYEQMKPQLAQAAKRRDELLQKIERYRERLRDSVRRAGQTFLREMASMIPAWGAELEIKSHINPLKVWSIKDQTKAVTEEVIRGLQPRIQTAMSEWEKTDLRPLLEHGIEEMTDGLNASLLDFFNRLDALRGDLTSNVHSSVSAQTGRSEAEVSPLERVLAGAAGLFFFNPGMAVSGATLGYQGMVQGLLPQIAVAIGAILLGVTNPIALAAILLGAGLGQALWKGGKITAQAKTQVAQAMAQQLHTDAPERADEIAAKVYEQTQQLAAAVRAGLDREIQGIQEQVEAVLSVKKEGEAKVEAQRQALEGVEKQLRTVDAELTSMICSLAQAPTK